MRDQNISTTELLAELAQMRGLFTSMLSGVVFCKAIYDEQGNMVDCFYEDMNTVYEQLTNLKKATAIGKKVSEMLPGTEPSWFEMFGQVVKTGKPVAFEMYHEQSQKFYSVYAYRPKEDRFAAIFDNITSQKKIEEALVESEKQFETAIIRAPIPMVIVNANQDILLYNNKFIELFGYKLKDISTTEEWWLTAYPDEEYRQLAQKSWEVAIEKVAESGDEIEMQEWDLTAKDGSVRRVEVKMTFLGEISLIAMNDITERKRSEEKLRESEERFRAIFETAQDSIFIKNRALQYIQVSPGMARIFDLPAEKLIGCTNEDLFGEKIGEQVNKVDARVLNGEVVEEENTRVVQGIPRTFHIIKVPMRDKSGSITGICGIARDITERKIAEESLQKLNAELDERVNERTADLNKLVRLMAGREVRMAELKKTIKKLRQQLEDAGMTPIANDPLLGS